MKHKPKQDQPTTETDPRFPSGPWTGFWIQSGWGKQKTSLSLAFFAGRVRGGGRDMAGRFDVRGTYDLKTGRVLITKKYEEAHTVDYDGANQGDGMWLWGVWTMDDGDRGGFHLWPEGEQDPTQRREKAEKQEPVKRTKRRLVLEEVGK